MDLLSNHCSHRPLALLLARQGHQAAEQHFLPGQGKVSASPCQLQREGRAEARRLWLVQLSRSHSTMPGFCLPGQWDGNLKRSGLSYKKAAPREQWQMAYEPGSENPDCPTSLVQSKWKEEEVRAIWPLPRTKTSNLHSLQRNKLKQTKSTISFAWAAPAWGRRKWGFGFSLSTSPVGHEERHDTHLIRQNKEAAQSHCEKATSPVTKEGPGFLVHLLLGHCLNSRTAKAQAKCSRHEAANTATATWLLFPSLQ